MAAPSDRLGALKNRLRKIRPDMHQTHVQEKIRDCLLQQSATITEPDFTQITATDLQLLFNLYDAACFEGQLREAIGNSPLKFNPSRRMTRRAGSTKMWTRRDGTGRRSFEIGVSLPLLWGSFGDVHRQTELGGLPCPDRLTALMRIFEHELIHLCELLVWNKSSCSQDRFQTLARGLFGHREFTHDLITPREKALEQFGIRPGIRVRFSVNGTSREGLVNRVTKRATVLVPDKDGRLYSDGVRYRTWYVPVSELTVLEDS